MHVVCQLIKSLNLVKTSSYPLSVWELESPS